MIPPDRIGGVVDGMRYSTVPQAFWVAFSAGRRLRPGRSVVSQGRREFSSAVRAASRDRRPRTTARVTLLIGPSPSVPAAVVTLDSPKTGTRMGHSTRVTNNGGCHGGSTPKRSRPKPFSNTDVFQH